jgi:hypothetical protein
MCSVAGYAALIAATEAREGRAVDATRRTVFCREQADTMLEHMLTMTSTDLPSTHRPGRHPTRKQRVGAVGPRIPVYLEVH